VIPELFLELLRSALTVHEEHTLCIGFIFFAISAHLCCMQAGFTSVFVIDYFFQKRVFSFHAIVTLHLESGSGAATLWWCVADSASTRPLGFSSSWD